ncbi:MAG TPA: L,D-transpeptidase family protein [Ardenticatenaceae bacterium]|jgi:lipoprotein-anchoring transpeptidase ErfK/SrfK
MSAQPGIAKSVTAIRAALRRGDRQEAWVLAAALRTQWPENPEGWLWSARLSDTPEDAARYAARASNLDLAEKNEEALDEPRTSPGVEETATHPSLEADETGLSSFEYPDDITMATEAAKQPSLLQRFRARPYALLDTTIVLSFVILTMLGSWLAWDRTRPVSPPPAQAIVEADPAQELKREAGRLWVAGQRFESLAKWDEAYQLRPSADVAESLARAHVAISSDLLKENRPDEAFNHLQAAYNVMPEEEAVLHEYQALLAYRAGRDAVAARDWTTALEALGPLASLDPPYLDAPDLMERALAGQHEAQAAEQARETVAFNYARNVEAGQLLRAALTPIGEISNQPGQTTMPDIGSMGARNSKHIVVSINAQRMYVYENGQLIWDWTASTGENGRPTIPGRYRIQSKIENARSNVWSLWMPYWQGIYWAGSVENGIHGQVTFDAGGRLWEGYLGTRITFGCVMISDEHAGMLYNWTEVGTPISIHWDWDPAWVPDANGDPLAG